MPRVHLLVDRNATRHLHDRDANFAPRDRFAEARGVSTQRNRRTTRAPASATASNSLLLPQANDAAPFVAIARLDGLCNDDICTDRVVASGVGPHCPEYSVLPCSDNVLFTTYRLQIGPPFGGGAGCSAIQQDLLGNVEVTGFGCQGDGNGDTQRQFNAPSLFDVSKQINGSLDSLSPALTDFNCPAF